MQHGDHQPVPSSGMPPGWYPDPWGQPGQWRWWGGHSWTASVTTTDAQHKPRRPAWLSIPVIIAAVFMIPLLGITAVIAPLSAPLGLVPAAIVCPVMLWLDRIEPEPRAARVHALLWGALVATGVALVVNTLVGAALGEAFATVVSAPVVEEAMKAAAILWAVRRLEVDGVMDGVIYAGWAGIGFAVVEDMLYFATALEQGDLVIVFVIRALLSPFAHPLFTAWTGMAIGWAVRRRKPVLPAALGGYVIAVASHALWNGSLVNADRMGGGLFLLVTVIIFVTLFLSVAVVLYRLRRSEERRFLELVPWLSARYRLPDQEIAVFGTFRQMLRARRILRPEERRRFDDLHAALARLALLHDRLHGADPESEARLVDQLRRAGTRAR
ncbi:MAG TPA: PrsW family glutamic-type intramembrane protease [Euzebya sp.]|nr:PrsW family glutamic-type intramembrane protease [Euzebya sp.]